MYKSMIRVISLNKLNCFLSLLMNNSYQWRIQGRGPGGPAPPLIFSPDLGPKGRKKIFFWRPPPPPPPLSEGLDDRPPPTPPYSKLWIRRCIHTTNLLSTWISIQRATIFIINLHGSIINSLLYIVQSD